MVYRLICFTTIVVISCSLLLEFKALVFLQINIFIICVVYFNLLLLLLV
uniref:Uncharacterized protein n=1 Tax=Manihot esculenta TaxID=3983 RepID=A0A2C9UDK7_MANES